MPMITVLVSAVPKDDDVVAGWVAFVVFAALAVAVVFLGFSLTKRLRNVDRAAEQGLYDPSDPKPEKPARGLAAARRMRQDAAGHEDPGGS